MRSCVYFGHCPMELFAFVHHFFVVTAIQDNSFLNSYLFIGRRASRFRTSSAAFVPSGGKAEHGKIKKMNQLITLWKAKQTLRWSECVYLGAGLWILRYWESVGIRQTCLFSPLLKRFRISRHLSHISYWLTRKLRAWCISQKIRNEISPFLHATLQFHGVN